MPRRTRALPTLAVALIASLVPAGAAEAAPRTTLLTADLTGAAEVPGPGDTDGSGTSHVRVGRARVCFRLTVADVAPLTAGHIHRGRRGEAGPVVVPFFTTPQGGSATRAGCVKVTRRLAGAIRRHPRRYYVNVHNAEFPAGAVRGQLER